MRRRVRAARTGGEPVSSRGRRPDGLYRGRVRIGLHLPQFREAVDAGLVREVATMAEEAGIDDLWVSDHVILPVGSTRPPESFHDALTVLAFAAATTRRIGLGTSVMVAPYRHPVVLARAVATLDALAGGRVVLGVASGWLASEFAALGGPVRAPWRPDGRDDRRLPGALVGCRGLRGADRPPGRHAPRARAGTRRRAADLDRRELTGGHSPRRRARRRLAHH